MGPAWLRGVFPPIATPFQAGGTLGAPVTRFLEHLRDAGLDGVVALGSNGEAAALSDRERIEWIQALRLALPPPLRLLAGTGAESTRQTIERTQAAAAAGAECALVITPMVTSKTKPVGSGAIILSLTEPPGGACQSTSAPSGIGAGDCAVVEPTGR